MNSEDCREGFGCPRLGFTNKCTNDDRSDDILPKFSIMGSTAVESGEEESSLMDGDWLENCFESSNL